MNRWMAKLKKLEKFKRRNWRNSKIFKPWFFPLLNCWFPNWIVSEWYRMWSKCCWIVEWQNWRNWRNSKKFKPWFFSLLNCWFPNLIVSEWYMIGSKCCWIVEWQNWRNWRNLKKILALIFFPVELLISQLDSIWMIYDRVKMLLNPWMANWKKI